MRWSGKQVTWALGKRSGVVLERVGDRCKIRVDGGEGHPFTWVQVSSLTVTIPEDLRGWLHETIDRMSADQARRVVRFVSREIL